MIQFKSLRLSGFKSFVDRTELEIAPGLNGIVGPNGCGKSNLVEALRWLMGESSAKRMRGGGMEDVIFAGTSKRSARNIAEVSLLLDNASREAPAAYNNSDELEIIRRIERDHGSSYKINGRNARARDVQMLFADTVTGANSPALVSQGRVTQIINAKPLDRRMILEESAGISGLYARRHEAELRLRAADSNLVRLEDVLGSMQDQLGSLKRQARQASRYRNINAQIRQLELMIAALEWTQIEEKRKQAQTRFNEAEAQVAQYLTAVTQLTKTQTTQAEEIAPLRSAEAEAAAALQRQTITLQRLEDEAARAEENLRETLSQIEQTRADHAHENDILKESTTVLEKLEGELKAIAAKDNNQENTLEEKRRTRDELESKVLTLEEQYNALMQSTAEAKARRASLEQQIEQHKQRLETMQARREKASAELKEFAHNETQEQQIISLAARVEEFEKTANKLAGDITTARSAIETAQQAVESARENVSAAQNRQSEWRAEISMLESFFEAEENESFTPVLESMRVESGFEKALSRALGDSLMASLEENAAISWRKRGNLSGLPALPEGVTALLPHVNAPEALHAALSQIGYIAEETDGAALADQLLPGQSLVSAGGTYWRWDGLTVRGEAPDRHARHLEYKNKLAELQKKAPGIESAVEKAQKALETAQQQKQKAEQALEDLQDRQGESEQARRSAEHELSGLKETQARAEAQRTRLEETLNLANEDIGTVEELLKWDTDRLAAYADQDDEKKQQDTESLRTSLMEAREAHQGAVSAFDMHQQEQRSREARIQAIGDERINLQNRSIRARERIKMLEERSRILEEKRVEIADHPKTFKSDKEKLLSLISQLEAKRSAAAEKLAAREAEVAETGKALKEAENAMSEAREARAHAQATVSALQEQIKDMETSISEKFDMPPAQLQAHAAEDLEKNTQSIEDLRASRDKLTNERNNIGPVNLRADEEAQEMEKEVTKLLNERNDLMEAIAELRGGIQKINREARERLNTAFEHVNAHFQRLFVQLFGGGEAHLALVEPAAESEAKADGKSEKGADPLSAGLEIFAQPPGKSLQSLSLLSGGEQTLASIALIFAMFLTNPSPICVLDEIDAPLDDANVERVCDLLDDIAARGQTRFLIITHHRMTMARMDRLYGVTMAERGVSQLVSVDLQQSFEFLEAA